MGAFWQDLRYGVGRLRKTPLLAAVASLTLGLAIGANSAIFSLLDALFFRPLPVEEPERWARIYTGTLESPQDQSSYPDFEDYRAQLSSFTDLVASGRRGALLRVGDAAEMIIVEVVSRNYFDALGVTPALGRTWLPSAQKALDEDPVVISHDLWRRRFGSDAEIAGKPIHLTGKNLVIGGVASREFPGLDRLIAVDAWISTETWSLLMNSRGDFQRREYRWFDIWGRLAASTSVEQARAECSTVTARLAQSYPDTNQGRVSSIAVETEERQRAGFVLAALLMTLAGLVILVCCANIANLLLAQSEARRREMATRCALGASRGRIAGQVLTESLLLSAIGGTLGLLLAWWVIDLLPTLMPQTSVRLNLDFRMDARVLTFTLFACLLATIVFGGAPALHAARVDLMSVLRGERGIAGGRKSKLGVRNLLVVGQVAACVALLTTSGLLIRSLVHSNRIHPGFERKPMLLLNINPSLAGYGRDQTQGLLEDLRERLESLPGVVQVSYAMRAPLSPSGGGAAVEVSLPTTDRAGQEPGLKTKYNAVGPNYFTTLGTRILRGRAFEAQDDKTSEPVVLINRTMALRFWPDDRPIGKAIRIDDSTLQIVGVVEDTKINHIRERPEPYLYFPMAQRPRSEVTLMIATLPGPAALVDPVRETVRSIAPGVPILQLTTQDELMHYALYNEHMYARLASTLGLLGLCLAATGLFGVISYLVRQKTNEIGIRMALGAQSRDVLLSFVKRGLALSFVGIAVGASGSLFAAGLLSPFLRDVSPRDPLSFLAAAGIVSLTAALASYLPARRAAKVDPMQALRYQ